MSDYRETTVKGTSYTRGRSLYFENPLNATPGLLIREEQVTNLDGRTIFEPAGEILKAVTDLSIRFPIIDPLTNQPVPDADMSYQDLYVAMYSLYWHLALERDELVQVVDPNPEPEHG